MPANSVIRTAVLSIKKILPSPLKNLVRKVSPSLFIHAWHKCRYPKNHLFNLDWGKIAHSHTDIVKTLVNKSKGVDTQYLEIGCFEDDLFKVIPSLNKVGVDPLMGGTLRMTSDEFFAQNTKCFDVIFLDGLHEYHQLRRDLDNALKYLNPGGWIALHDLLPRNKSEQHVPQKTTAWVGDCWKVGVELNHSQGIEFHIVRISYGVGILRKTDTDDVHVPDMSGTLSTAGFNTFLEHFKKLPIINFEEAIDLISKHSN